MFGVNFTWDMGELSFLPDALRRWNALQAVEAVIFPGVLWIILES